MDCRHYQDMIQSDLDGSLSPQERREMAAHLLTCGHCRTYAAELNKTVAALRSTDELDPPPWLLGKIIRNIKEEEERPKGLIQKLFFPLHIKLPLEAFATLLVAALAFVVIKGMGPEMQPMQSVQPMQPSQPLQPKQEPLAEKSIPLQQERLLKKTDPGPGPEIPGTSRDSAPERKREAFLNELQQRPVEEPLPPAPAFQRPEPKEAPVSAEKSEAVQMKEPRAASGAYDAERKAIDITTVSLKVRDVTGAERELRSLLTRLGGSVRATEKTETGTTIIITVSPLRSSELLDQLKKIGSLRPPAAPSGAAGFSSYRIILEKSGD